MEAIGSSLERQGYPPGCPHPTWEAEDLMAAIAGWPVGTVVGRRLDDLVVRELPDGTGTVVPPSSSRLRTPRTL